MIVVETISYPVGRLNIQGRITELLNGQFYCELSHHYQTTENTKRSIQSAVQFDTLAEARDMLNGYALGFKGAFAIIKNPDY